MNLGIKLSSNSDKISHLLYDDDVLIFAEAKLQNISHIKIILAEYCFWTGKKNTLANLRKLAKRIGFRQVNELVYLGIMIVLRRYVNADFQNIIKHTLDKLNSWGSRCLSLVGRVGCLMIWINIAKVFDGIKTVVGQVCIILNGSTARIFGLVRPVEVIRQCGKFCCMELKHLKPLIRWKIGNGKSVQVLTDAWIAEKSLDRWPTYCDHISLQNLFVNELLNLDGSWEDAKLHRFFGEELIGCIKQISINSQMEEDCMGTNSSDLW
ncbi:hypothetical protein M5K25_000602 [Dendrobium thyrsiflorum]|uniref:Uncharacterized protein n=1 Tax=Dendrobium thyrsiflorum TaxID=117978 RepID=A0ABD0VVX1_DENTH